MNIIKTNFNYKAMTPRALSKIDRIILHHAAAANCSAEDIHKWHLGNGWAGIGYNFLVRKDGTKYECRPIEYVPAHATGYNTCSIGICFEGNFEVEEMVQAQKEAGKELVAHLKEKYNLNLVQRHKDVQNTACPGAKFPFEEIASSTAYQNSPKQENKAETTNYIANYQKAFNSTCGGNLVVDNIKGVKTNASLQKVCLKRGSRNELVRWCQDRLINHKHYYLKDGADGIFGSDTERVVKQFQRDNGLVADGIIGIKTISILF